ncbi:hypothetical protein Lpp221_03000 [Lacticaseibacillus paracasei subsp. paracasei Lpp221]|uniref:Uncharacterized protein n=9 Tax=Lacticaseibacillus paracasei TaxID=1597 RepID=Q035Z5_LACP3|nr:hypothetical protein LSEI_2232 [Lacticaseibacillus paracasei ATCC 334]AHJ33619.1 hypothetical protein AF91_10745 [Lacticaseibacillus paracasei N1115]AWN84546.1 hypothetical protein LPEG9_11450 [Lacticaseibacillus paracasei]EKQ09319.1 hypothetical protein LCAA2362_1474 [Lacticaseibacillus casei A2-362]EPC46285.1 hypothetical protein Lpp219_04615 [Lacticaseibacillus paracasei subsp. paracasei Lpp219]EPC51058.1 hypothetical protein Lpp77_13056 [Lacticaseibacillus paracasei subsp. paracasei CNC
MLISKRHLALAETDSRSVITHSPAQKFEAEPYTYDLLDLN